MDMEALKKSMESAKRAKLAEIQAQENALIGGHLKDFQGNLKELSKGGLNTINTDIEEMTQALSRKLNRLKTTSLWLTMGLPLMIGLSMSIGGAIGMWSLGALVSSKLEELERAKAELKSIETKIGIVKDWKSVTMTYQDGFDTKLKPEIYEVKGGWFVRINPIKKQKKGD